MSDLQIKQIQFDDCSKGKLRDFLSTHSTTTLFHSFEWRNLLKDTWGHETVYWSAWLDGQLTGIFPVVIIRMPLLGSKFIALPYQLHSGLPVAESSGIQEELVRTAQAHARQAGAGYLEIRHYEQVDYLGDLGFVPVDTQLSTTSVDLTAIEYSRLRKTRRQEIRYAENRDIRIESCTSVDALREFRNLYIQENRAKGSPQAGWRYFQAIRDHLPDNYHLLLARRADNSALAGYLTIDDGRTAFARAAAYGSQEASRLQLSKSLNWKAMTAARERGCREFNLGITWVNAKGLIAFKESWGGITRPVHQYVYAIKGKPPSPGDYFGGYSFAKAVWRRLPLPIVNMLGAQVSRWIC